MGNTSNTDARRLNAAERAKKAAEMRKAGASLQEIADACGYSHRGSVSRVLKEHIQKLPANATEDLRATLDGKLAKAEAKAWPLMNSRNPNIRLRAVETVGRNVQRRAEICGLPKLVQLDTGGPHASEPSAGEWDLSLFTPAELGILAHLRSIGEGTRPEREALRKDAAEWLCELSAPPIAALPSPRVVIEGVFDDDDL